ncbi:MAG: zinc-binding dehydrogenase, partial [Thermoanaerobaculia bacterium]
RYDLILDCVGNHSLSACRRALNPKGIYIGVGGPDGRWIGPLARSIKALVLFSVREPEPGDASGETEQEDLSIMHQLMEAGKVTPVIDRRYKVE